MNISHPIADMLTQIKNAQAVGHEHVSVPFSKLKWAVAGVLRDEHYVTTIQHTTKTIGTREHPSIDITLRYQDGESSIHGIKLISRPSRHLYTKASELKLVRSGLGMAVVSTSKGILTSRQARKENVGGEVLFEIW